MITLVKFFDSLYFLICVIFGNVIFRFLPTRLAMALMKRLNLDIRLCWEYERLNFLHLISDNNLKTVSLKIYYIISPINFGLTWGCAMESTFRVFNILNSLGDNAGIKFLKKEYFFVKNNLELHSNNNHILFNYITMVLLSKYFEPSYKHVWMEKLQQECQNQFYSDGGNFESSSSYHILSTEALLLLIKLDPDSKSLLDYLNIYGAVDIVKDLQLKNNQIFLLGDNDSSFVVKTNGRTGQCERILNDYGLKNLTGTQKLRVYEKFGLIVSEQLGKIKVVIWNPPAGQNGKCGHDHNDNLSILVSYDGIPIIIDPGTYYYSLFRNYFRSQYVHNNIKFSELNYEKMLGRFKLGNEYDSSISMKKNRVIAEIHNKEHHIQRTLYQANNFYQIEDEVTSTGEIFDLQMSFILAENISVCSVGDNYFSLSANIRDKKVLITFEFDDFILVTIDYILYSKEYSKIDQTKRLVVKFDNKLIRWKIYESEKN